MSFICEKCFVPQPNRSKPKRLVTQRRAATDVSGWQIAREINVCVECDPDRPAEADAPAEETERFE